MKPNRFLSNYVGEEVSSYLYKEEDFAEFKRFDMGESAFPFTPKVFDEIKKFNESDMHDYPDPCLFELKKKIAEIFKVKPEMVTTGAGSDEIIELIPRLLLNEGDKALAIIPTFFRFLDSVARMNCEITMIHTKEAESFAINDNIIEKIIREANDDGVKLIWLCNPNNPTGVMMSLEQIKQVLDKTDCFVVVDEALHEFIDPTFKSSAVKLIDGRKNLLVLRSLSKAYGLAGIRFGFGIGDEETISFFEKFRLPYNSSTLSQKVALAVLKDHEHLKRTVQKTSEIKSELIKELKTISGIHIASETMTNTILLKHKDKDLFSDLHKRKVLVADFRNANGLEGRGYVRIIVRDKDMNDFLVKELRDICS
ncbi:MAG: histidinol-phosphate aminotransferase family protein [DPANN group archaeon]|nr:histidinol-phosphate aminotransferase family protein [DPANN group archaeon]